MAEQVTIFVPAEDSDLGAKIADGAGVVGSEVGDTGRLRVDFEGNEDLFPTFRARVRRAAERHAWIGPAGEKGYPTRACAYASPDELVAVGQFDLESNRLSIRDRHTLREWLNETKPNGGTFPVG